MDFRLQTSITRRKSLEFQDFSSEMKISTYEEINELSWYDY